MGIEERKDRLMNAAAILYGLISLKGYGDETSYTKQAVNVAFSMESAIEKRVNDSAKEA